MISVPQFVAMANDLLFVVFFLVLLVSYKIVFWQSHVAACFGRMFCNSDHLSILHDCHVCSSLFSAMDAIKLELALEGNQDKLSYTL